MNTALWIIAGAQLVRIAIVLRSERRNAAVTSMQQRILGALTPERVNRIVAMMDPPAMTERRDVGRVVVVPLGGKQQ